MTNKPIQYDKNNTLQTNTIRQKRHTINQHDTKHNNNNNLSLTDTGAQFAPPLRHNRL